jgi:hypothetical protein
MGQQDSFIIATRATTHLVVRPDHAILLSTTVRYTLLVVSTIVLICVFGPILPYYRLLADALLAHIEHISFPEAEVLHGFHTEHQHAGCYLYLLGFATTAGAPCGPHSAHVKPFGTLISLEQFRVSI